jgi:hypothetical protein
MSFLGDITAESSYKYGVADSMLRSIEGFLQGAFRAEILAIPISRDVYIRASHIESRPDASLLIIFHLGFLRKKTFILCLTVLSE